MLLLQQNFHSLKYNGKSNFSKEKKLKIKMFSIFGPVKSLGWAMRHITCHVPPANPWPFPPIAQSLGGLAHINGWGDGMWLRGQTSHLWLNQWVSCSNQVSHWQPLFSPSLVGDPAQKAKKHSCHCNGRALLAQMVGGWAFAKGSCLFHPCPLI